MQSASEILLSNESATGSEKRWPGGRGVMSIGGNWAGGGTVALQYKLPNGSFANVSTYTTFTANGFGGFDLPEGIIKATVTGTVASMYATVARVPS